MLLILALACSKPVPPDQSPAAESSTAEHATADAAPVSAPVSPPPQAQPQATSFGPTAAAISAHYDPVPAALAGCALVVGAQVSWLAQLTCPNDRIITDMRGVGVPEAEEALQLVMETQTGLGLSAMPRQAEDSLADGQTSVQVVDAVGTVGEGEGEALAVTTWVLHNPGATPQLLTCMGLTEDADARAFCLSALGDMMLVGEG